MPFSLMEEESRSMTEETPGAASERTWRLSVAIEPDPPVMGVDPAQEMETSPGGVSLTTKAAPGVRDPGVIKLPVVGAEKMVGS